MRCRRGRPPGPPPWSSVVAAQKVTEGITVGPGGPTSGHVPGRTESRVSKSPVPSHKGSDTTQPSVLGRQDEPSVVQPSRDRHSAVPRKGILTPATTWRKCGYVTLSENGPDAEGTTWVCDSYEIYRAVAFPGTHSGRRAPGPGEGWGRRLRGTESRFCKMKS